MSKSLYAMWLDAHNRKSLPPEWAFFIDFRFWANETGYKPEFGFKGEFTKAILTEAMTNAQKTEISKSKIASEFNIPEQILNQVPEDQYERFVNMLKPEDAGNTDLQESQKAMDNAYTGIALASGSDVSAVNGEIISNVQSAAEGSMLTGHLDAEDLVKTMKLDELKKLAADMGIDIGDAKTKSQIAELIAAVEVQTGENT